MNDRTLSHSKAMCLASSLSVSNSKEPYLEPPNLACWGPDFLDNRFFPRLWFPGSETPDVRVQPWRLDALTPGGQGEAEA